MATPPFLYEQNAIYLNRKFAEFSSKKKSTSSEYKLEMAAEFLRGGKKK